MTEDRLLIESFINTLNDKEIEWLLENDEFDAINSGKARKLSFITVNNRKILNHSKARLGVFGLVNKLIQKARQEKFNENVQSGVDSNKIRIVSEGDSWFNYPTQLKEVIDRIFDRYSIFSLGYAGDWLSNIYIENEYIPAIRKYRPEIFLISGGGNDMVGGGRMEEVLNKYSGNDNIDHLLNHKEFNSILDDFKIIFTSIFEKLKIEFPELKIICHGYDYPYLDGEEKKWFGKPMREKGINNIATRKTIGNYMIDEFNEMLKKVATEYPRVYYLDLRGKVPRDKWFDELHPNDEGFKIVADLYNKMIESI